MNILQRAVLRLAGVKDLATLHPEAFTREMLFSGYSGSGPAEAQAPVSNAYEEYVSQPWIYKATRTVALSFRQVPLYVMRGEEYAEGHPLERLLTQPNPSMSGSALWERWITDVYLSGEIGLEVVGRGSNIVELWPRRGQLVTITHPARYPIASSYTIKDQQGEYRLAPDEFIWAWLYNPINEFRGLGIFQAAALGVRSDRHAQQYAASFFKGMARPDYVVTTPQGVTKTEKDIILAQIEAMTQGRNRGIVMEAGVTDIKPLSFAPKDLIWETIRSMSREEIGAVAGVPGELMGDKSATYENRKEATKSFWYDTMQPLCRWRDELLTNFFRQRGALRPDESILSDFSGVEALEQSYADRIAYATSLVALGVSLADANEMMDLGIPESSLRNGESEASMTPSEITGPDVPEAPETVDRSMVAQSKAVEASTPVTVEPEFGGAEHLAILDRWEKAIAPREQRMRQTVKRLISEMGDDAIRRLTSSQMKTADDAARDPFDMTKWIRLFRLKLSPLIRLTMAEAGRDAMQELNIGVSFDVANPLVLDWMRDRENKLSGIVETTFNQVRDTIIEGIDAGETTDDIKRRIVEVTQGEIGEKRARTISRTEANGAMNGGQVLAWKQSGVVVGKRWIAALNHLPPDPKPVRDTHVEAHGQVVGLDEDFLVGDGSGPCPGSIGLPEEDINCRCSMISVTRSERP